MLVAQPFNSLEVYCTRTGPKWGVLFVIRHSDVILWFLFMRCPAGALTERSQAFERS